MSAEHSLSTGEPYGVKRVCETLDVPRSSFYEKKRRKHAKGSKAKKRGPVPAITYEELLELILEDLESSPFTGEGHRKVWARLYYGKKVKVAKKRVLAIMRENNLLSPHRRPQMPAREHDGEIITHAPNIMWGTDGAKVFTTEEGWGWIFVNVEHWNAEVMGWHVCKRGDRFAALEPVSMGVMSQYGSVERGVARGLKLRMDHGNQYTSDHFGNQIKAWGITPSYAFVEQPQTNGVAERFIRTLKEQAIYGRTFNTIEEVRQAVAEFVELYNNEWLIEKNGYLSPRQAREAYYISEVEAAA